MGKKKVKLFDIPNIFTDVFDVPQIDLLEKITDEELEWLKQGAVEAHDYNVAIKYRDEQKRRKENSQRQSTSSNSANLS